MTGGFPDLNLIDIEASNKFLSHFLSSGEINNDLAIGIY